MSHNIYYNKTTEKHSFVTVREKAWHNLGTVVSDRMTSEECIKEAGLDFHVEKGECYVKYNNLINDKKGEIIPNKKVTYRTDTGESFGIVSDDYEILQNIEAFNFFDNVVKGKRAIFETAGALKSGEIVFITAKLPKNLIVKNVDTINQYLLFTSTHDGTGSILCKFTPIRVVCNNTLNAALKEKSNVIFRIKHTKNLRDKLAIGEKIIGISEKVSLATTDLLNKIVNIKLTEKETTNIVCTTFLTPLEMSNLMKSGNSYKTFEDISTNKKNVIDNVLNNITSGIGQDMNICKGTAYGVYNGITGYFQNVRNYKDEEHRFESINKKLGLTHGVLERLLEYS
jgi:phage/plasmid-like protein (TIGR03299 family)